MNSNNSIEKILVLFIISVIAFSLIIGTNISASISPENEIFELDSNDCYTSTLTVTLPDLPPKVDVMFSFDLSPSMFGIVELAKEKTIEIMNSLIENNTDVLFNFGVISYMDYTDDYQKCGYQNTYGYSGHPYYLEQSLTNDIYLVSTVINSLTTGGNSGDGPEAYTRVFYESYSDENINWRADSRKLLVNFGDDFPHDCNINEGIYSEIRSTGRDPGRDEIMDTSDDLDLHDVLASMNSNGIILLECHSMLPTSEQPTYWEYWTSLTGGGFYWIQEPNSNFVEIVINAIMDGVTQPKVYGLHLEVTTQGYESWLSNVIPPAYAELDSEENVTFNKTICVPDEINSGNHTFVISAIDDFGVGYGEQTIQISLNSPPEVVDIADKTIDEGENFATITLDDFVTDSDNSDEEMQWSYTGNVDLTVDITDRIATITQPDSEWSGQETIIFTATDPDGLFDSDSAIFTINPVNDAPILIDIPDQIIDEGEAFDTIDLDDYVSDIDNTDEEILWNVTGQTELIINITNRIATITTPTTDWFGQETITFKATDPQGAFDEDSAIFTANLVNSEPNKPYNPIPANGSNEIQLNTNPTWTCNDSDGDEITYEIYFGTNTTPDLVMETTSNELGPQNLAYSTRYYWYIVAIDPYGGTNTSKLWHFTTIPQPSSNAGGPPVTDVYLDPIADASAGKPYFGFVGEEITFDGTESYDPNPDGYIVEWEWHFRDGDKGYGEIVNHTYEEDGTYNVQLVVENVYGAIDTDTVEVIISKGDYSPTTPLLEGPSQGHINTDYEFTATSYDLDDEEIQYIFDWGDSENTTSELVQNGTALTISHNWSLAGTYTITVIATDGEAESGPAIITINIDYIPISGPINGYLLDQDSDGVYDTFNNEDTGQESALELDDETYLIDSDANDKWDHTYNDEKGLQTYTDYVYNKYMNVYEEQMATPGFELFVLLVAFALVVIVLRKKNKD